MADNNHDQVLSCLTEAGEPLSIRNITATTGLKTAEVKEVLDALKTEGRAASAKSGRAEQWSLTDRAESDTGEPTAEGGEADPVEPNAAEETEPSTEENDEEELPEVHVPEVDAEMIFTATMLDQFAHPGRPFDIEWFAATCGKTTTAERTRLLRTLWALGQQGLVNKSDPNDVDGGEWTVTETGLASIVVARRLQITDAPEQIEVRIVKRMPWANGGAKAGRSRGDRVRGDTKPARVRGELRVQIDAVLTGGAIEQPFTPAAVAEAVRAADAHHRDADPNAVNNYLKELQHDGSLTDATAETGQRAYRLA